MRTVRNSSRLLGGGCLLPGGYYPSMHWGRPSPPPWIDTQVWKHNLRNFVEDGSNLVISEMNSPTEI